MATTVESASPAARATALRREAGQLVAGRFRIEQELAEGGMGVVFRARDERSGKQLALKQLRVQGQPSSTEIAALRVQFEREYHTLSQLSHPCIIAVYDYGIDEGGAYYTMELLQGQDLRQRGKLPWREACAVLRDIASSLAILHSRRLLHRDVTARNVFCIEGGRSKLIDFGAMTPMGVAKHLVGTPPFVPLEALQQQSLDGRADLYSLGALAYWVITGTHAYSARSFAELKERFGTPPPTLRQHDPEVPQALDELLMSLLQLDRSARPGSAAEVMERLSGIAGLGLQEHAEVSRAYLSMPNLVGRDASLERIRVDLLGGRQGNGTSVLIEGAAGSGRSRMLDACVLHAKLRGALVLRSDAADGARGPYGIVRALGSQLLDALPSEALYAARGQRELLAHVLPQLGSEATTTTGAAPERRQLQSALRDWILAVARDKHVVIAVDDIERGDEPSAALLAALAHGARRRRLNLIFTTLTGAPGSAALSLLRLEAQSLPLLPLQPTEAEALLRSVFGDVPHMSALAERIFAVAAGNPGATMMLADHLVAQGIARYEAGGWALPAELRPDHLPSSAGAALEARIAQLPPDARELAQVLALTEPEAIAPELYPQLSEHGDHGRTYRALEALTASGVLTLVGDRYRFNQFDAPAILERMLEPARAQAFHALLANALQDSDRRERVAHHMLLGGQEREAIARLIPHFARTNQYTAQGIEMLQRASDAAQRLGLPLAVQLELHGILLSAAATLGQRALFLAHADVLLQRIESDSGLFDYHQLPADMDDAARAAEGMRRAEARYHAATDAERGFAPQESWMHVLRVYAAFSTMSSITQDLELVERLPRLEPLLSRMPMLVHMQSLIDGCLALQSGHSSKALQLCKTMVERLEHPTEADGPAFFTRALRLAQLYTLGLFAATGGQSKAREQVAELEHVPGHRVNAWRVRMVYELMHGNMEAASDCQRRAELLNLQDGGSMQLPGTTARVELLAHMYADDVIGVKRATERIAELAESYPGWRPTLAIARCHYRRLQGDAAGALAELEPALQTRAGRHMDWWLVAYSHLRVLCELDRPAEAVSHGERYLATWKQEQLSLVDYGLGQAMAEALLRVDRVAEAKAMIEEYIDMHQRAGTRGLRLGLAYETRARVAIAQRDERAVQNYTRLCAQQYKGGRHLALLNRYARLLREADAGGIALTTGLRFGADMQASALHTQTAHTVQSRMLACVGSSERAQTGLRVLLESSGAQQGYLYGLRERRLFQLAPLPAEGPAPDGLSEWLETYLRGELEGELATAIDTGSHDADTDDRFRDTDGREFEPVLLCGKRDGDEVVAGIAAIHYTSNKRPVLRRGVIEALTEILIADGIVDAIAQ